MKRLAKWIKIIEINLNKTLAYKLNFILLILGPPIVFYFIKYNLWQTIFQSSSSDIIQGYTFKTMINYHSWVLILSLLSQGHTAMNLSEEIRLGKISSYLIYPIEFWEFHFASFLSFTLLQIIVVTATFLFFWQMNIIILPHYLDILCVFFYCLLVSLFWFSIQFFLGLFTFWIEESWILRVLFQVISSFLSGAVMPLELFPSNIVKALSYSPFPYMTYYPIKYIQSQSVDLSRGVLMLTLWIFIFWIGNSLLWKRGIKLYSGAGI